MNEHTLRSLAMAILIREHVLAARSRVPRPLNEFELAPRLSDLSNVHGNKHERRRMIRANGAACARLNRSTRRSTLSRHTDTCATVIQAWPHEHHRQWW
jgi:hypothetical protein